MTVRKIEAFRDFFAGGKMTFFQTSLPTLIILSSAIKTYIYINDLKLGNLSDFKALFLKIDKVMWKYSAVL